MGRLQTEKGERVVFRAIARGAYCLAPVIDREDDSILVLSDSRQCVYSAIAPDGRLELKYLRGGAVGIVIAGGLGLTAYFATVVDCVSDGIVAAQGRQRDHLEVLPEERSARIGCRAPQRIEAAKVFSKRIYCGSVRLPHNLPPLVYAEPNTITAPQRMLADVKFEALIPKEGMLFALGLPLVRHSNESVASYGKCLARA